MDAGGLLGLLGARFAVHSEDFIQANIKLVVDTNLMFGVFADEGVGDVDAEAGFVAGV